MAIEPTLQLKKEDFQSQVGFYLGYGRGEDAGDTEWDDHQAADVEDCLRSGLRQFYYPPPINGSSYEWSFLRPIANFELEDGVSTLAMPNDFGGVQGDVIAFVSGEGRAERVPIVLEIKVRELFAAQPDATGWPRFCSVIPMRGTGATEGQRFQMIFWPEADQDYQIQLTYALAPDALSGALPYAYGGPKHAETILASCLAIAEQRKNDARGVQWAMFMERLQASISMDRRLKPHKFGYNGDGMARDRWTRDRGTRGDYDQTVTIEGVTPT